MLTADQIEAAKLPCPHPGCTHRGLSLVGHLAEVHGESPSDYPGHPMVAAVVSQMAKEPGVLPGFSRKAGKSADDLRVKIAGIEFPVNIGVPAEACLPLPEGYSAPRNGQLGEDVKAIARWLSLGARTLLVWGEAGTGKDGLAEAYAALTRTPTLKLYINPNRDLAGYIDTMHVVEQDGASVTKLEKGALLRAVTEGYTTPDGTVVPYLIVLSDVDRGRPEQLEILRSMLEANGMVEDSEGNRHRVLPGTRFYATANSVGTGDVLGGMTTSNAFDISWFDRFQVARQFHQMGWSDTETIIRARHPELGAHPQQERLFGTFKAVTMAMRDAYKKGDTFQIFSLRTVTDWAGMAARWLAMEPDADVIEVLRQTATCWQHKGDPDAQDFSKRVLDPILGGQIPTVDREDEVPLF